MSDYCEDCEYDPDDVTGEQACPFNTLYWAFLDRNESTLREVPRMGLVYSHLDDKSTAELDRIRDRAETVRTRTRDGSI
ncbi:MAG: hypothetical protein U5K37_09815 [Natrialbaceae archaeon]|nr:hypothetical protein [Natrialbaceae archaeon]